MIYFLIYLMELRLEADRTTISVKGNDKQLVGSVASKN